MTKMRVNTATIVIAAIAGMLAFSLDAETVSAVQVDLSDREPEIKERIIWDNNDLIIGCRANFKNTPCAASAYQYISIGYLRGEIALEKLSFLPIGILNGISFENKYRGEYCTNESIDEFINNSKPFLNANENIVTLEAITIETSWFQCFSSYGSLDEDYFLLWGRNRALGMIECGRVEFGSNPQCSASIFLNEDAGLSYHMEIGPFDAVNVKKFIEQIDRIINTFWEETGFDPASIGASADVSYTTNQITEGASVLLNEIEKELSYGNE